jgi:nitrogen fixation protein FixH
MTTRFSGRHMTAILLAFFSVVIAVNLTMALFATRTFGGVVVENSYVASQKYNGWLEAAKRQERLGWTIAATLDGSRHVVVSTNVKGAEVSGFTRHPLGREADVPLTFGTDRRSLQKLPAGRWAVHLLVRKGGDEARLIEVLS